MEGHAEMDMSVPAEGSLWQRIMSDTGLTAISQYFVKATLRREGKPLSGSLERVTSVTAIYLLTIRRASSAIDFPDTP
jgi:hypothetical protein